MYHKILVNETLEVQVIMGQKADLEILDLRNSIDQEVPTLYRGSSLILDRS